MAQLGTRFHLSTNVTTLFSFSSRNQDIQNYPSNCLSLLITVFDERQLQHFQSVKV